MKNPGASQEESGIFSDFLLRGALSCGGGPLSGRPTSRQMREEGRHGRLKLLFDHEVPGIDGRALRLREPGLPDLKRVDMMRDGAGFAPEDEAGHLPCLAKVGAVVLKID